MNYQSDYKTGHLDIYSFTFNHFDLESLIFYVLEPLEGIGTSFYPRKRKVYLHIKDSKITNIKQFFDVIAPEKFTKSTH